MSIRKLACRFGRHAGADARGDALSNNLRSYRGCRRDRLRRFNLGVPHFKALGQHAFQVDQHAVEHREERRVIEIVIDLLLIKPPRNSLTDTTLHPMQRACCFSVSTAHDAPENCFVLAGSGFHGIPPSTRLQHDGISPWTPVLQPSGSGTKSPVDRSWRWHPAVA